MEAATKTPQSRRTVWLGAEMMESLRRHYTRQCEERLKAGAQWQDNPDYVFRTRRGTPVDPTNVGPYFHGLTDDLGLPRVRVHDLRHMAASFMLSQGATPAEVAAALGHSTPLVTMSTYAHAVVDASRAAPTVRLGEALRSA